MGRQVTICEILPPIGLQISIGARKKDILKQFLLEAIFLSEVGGLVGILVGVIGVLVMLHVGSAKHPIGIDQRDCRDMTHKLV